MIPPQLGLLIALLGGSSRPVKKKITPGKIIGYTAGATFLVLSASIATTGVYSSVNYLKGNNPFNTIPRDNKISERCVKPSKLEVELKDVDGNGTNETLLNYNGKQYLFLLDKDNHPVVQSYIIEPAKVRYNNK